MTAATAFATTTSSEEIDWTRVTVHPAPGDPGALIGLFQVDAYGIGYSPEDARRDAMRNLRRKVKEAAAKQGAAHVRPMVYQQDMGINFHYHTTLFRKRVVRDGFESHYRSVFVLYR